MLTYAAGLRISETIAVQITDIKADRKLLHIRSGKGDVERMAHTPRAGDRVSAQLLADHLATTSNMAVLWQIPGNANQSGGTAPGVQ